MRNRIIVTSIGLFLSVGSIGGIERETMELGQAMILILIGGILLWIGIEGGEKDGRKNLHRKRNRHM